jgi:tetratricopeptide (TPR) repeat protein
LYADVYLRLATGKSVTGLEESIALCKKALDYNPEYGLAYYKLADNYSEQGNQPEAVGAYEKAVHYMPIVIDIWQKLINAYKAAGRPEDAERALRRVLDVQQKYSSSIYNK